MWLLLLLPLLIDDAGVCTRGMVFSLRALWVDDDESEKVLVLDLRVRFDELFEKMAAPEAVVEAIFAHPIDESIIYVCVCVRVCSFVSVYFESRIICLYFHM